MRSLELETALWHRFTSKDFYLAAASESEEITRWFGTLAISKGVANLGCNNQVFDTFKNLANTIKAGASMAELGQYRPVMNAVRGLGGDIKGLMDQPLRSWMTAAEFDEFNNVKLCRLLTLTGLIRRALTNALLGAESYFNPHPDYPERREDDDGFPGGEIIDIYAENNGWKFDQTFWSLPQPLPSAVVNENVRCATGEEVPSTGVWYPSVGLERHSLTFAIKGRPMQAAYRVLKTRKELKAQGFFLPVAETTAVATIWHPIVTSGRPDRSEKALWTKAGEQCPRAGLWRPTDPGAAPRKYELGEKMVQLNSPHGITVWSWVEDR